VANTILKEKVIGFLTKSYNYGRSDERNKINGCFAFIEVDSDKVIDLIRREFPERQPRVKFNAKYFAIETVLNLYKEDKLDVVRAVALLRGLAKGMGIKEAKEIVDKLNK